MNQVKILIVEDEILIAEYIKDSLLSIGNENVYFADSKETALKAMDIYHPDLILLDLHLEKSLDGLEIAKIIDQSFQIPYIFITANADVLVIQEAVQTKAAAYITKPLKKSDLIAAIQIALKPQASAELKFLLVKNTGSTTRIPMNDIMYIESNGNYIHICTKKEKTISRNSLEWAEESLPKNQFLRVHRSFLVNTNFVSRINAKSLFIGETEIPISRTVTSEVMLYFKSK